MTETIFNLESENYLLTKELKKVLEQKIEELACELNLACDCRDRLSEENGKLIRENDELRQMVRAEVERQNRATDKIWQMAHAYSDLKDMIPLVQEVVEIVREWNLDNPQTPHPFTLSAALAENVLKKQKGR